MPNKPRKSTTPNSDQVAKMYAGLYALHPHKTIERAQFYAEKCDKCGSKLAYLMSGYAFHQGSQDNAMICSSGHIVWLHIKTGEGK